MPFSSPLWSSGACRLIVWDHWKRGSKGFRRCFKLFTLPQLHICCTAPVFYYWFFLTSSVCQWWIECAFQDSCIWSVWAQPFVSSEMMMMSSGFSYCCLSLLSGSWLYQQTGSTAYASLQNTWRKCLCSTCMGKNWKHKHGRCRIH
jgi:hypothetical protein